MSGAQQRRGEPVPHERGIVGNDDGFGRGHGGRRRADVSEEPIRRGSRLVAEFIRFWL
jgi:hypothetical protein